MSNRTPEEQLIGAWQRYNEINLLLLAELPEAGLAAVPFISRGRTVARQFAHLHQVRLGWLHYHTTGKRPKREAKEKGREPARGVIASAD